MYVGVIRYLVDREKFLVMIAIHKRGQNRVASGRVWSRGKT